MVMSMQVVPITEINTIVGLKKIKNAGLKTSYRQLKNMPKFKIGRIVI